MLLVVVVGVINPPILVSCLLELKAVCELVKEHCYEKRQ